MNWRKVLVLQLALPTIRKERGLYKYYKELLDLEFQSREYIEKYQPSYRGRPFLLFARLVF